MQYRNRKKRCEITGASKNISRVSRYTQKIILSFNKYVSHVAIAHTRWTSRGSRIFVFFFKRGSNRSHLTIPSHRSREASVGSHAWALSRLRNFQRKREDVREHPTTADRRGEHDGAIIHDNRGFCECRKVVDDSALEPLNRAMSARGDYR